MLLLLACHNNASDLLIYLFYRFVLAELQLHETILQNFWVGSVLLMGLIEHEGEKKAAPCTTDHSDACEGKSCLHNGFKHSFMTFIHHHLAQKKIN